MDYQAFKQIIIAQAEALGLTEYELYYTGGSSTVVSAFRHEINEFSSSVTGGACFRCIVNGKMGYASTQALSEVEAKAIVAQAMANAQVLESDEQVFLCEGGKEYEPVDTEPYALPTTEELVAAVLDTQEKLYAADPAIIDGSETSGASQKSEIAICNSKGLDLYYSTNSTNLAVGAVASNGTEMATEMKSKTGELSTIDVNELVTKAAEGAKLKLGGDQPETAVCPIVLSPEAMCSFLQVFSAVFSSENAQKGLSKLGASEGKKIAADCVTLVDDPFHEENPVKINFDAEGCPAHCKNVIENGVLQTLLYNMKTAAVAGKQTTGNAAKDGYDGAVLVRPFTMYLAPGEYTEEEVLAKAGNGVMITSLGGLHAGANPISGDFSLQSAGFLIRDGKKADYVKSFTVAGNFYELLNKITAISDKVTVSRSYGAGLFGSPYVLIDELSIAGK